MIMRIIVSCVALIGAAISVKVFFYVINMLTLDVRGNAQKCKEESKDYDKSKNKEKEAIG